MRRSRGAKVGRWAYGRNRLRGPSLRLILALEGGAMYSQTLRDVLERNHGVAVGDYSYGSLLTPGFADPGTWIGRYVSVGPNVRRFGAAHPIDGLSMHPLFYNPALGLDVTDVERSECRIESDVWIGANAIILPGCRRIGFGAIVGAGAVVTRDVPDFAIVAGNPASVIRFRFSEDEIARQLELRPWELEPKALHSLLVEKDRSSA